MARQKLYNGEPTIRINTTIKVSHNDQLKELAGNEGKSVSDIVREIIDVFLEGKAKTDSRRIQE
jgi:predicted DNA-binding protein